MSGKTDTDVLVVGAGPVGLFAAHELVRRELDVRIVDQEWRTAAHSYALALHPRSLDLLDEAGLAKHAIENGCRIETIAFYEGAQRRAELKLSELPTEHPFLISMPQDALEGALERSLLQRRSKVRWNHRLSRLSASETATTAVVERRGKVSGGYAAAKTEWVVEKVETVASGFVVGADGHRSTVRRESGIDYEQLGERQLFAVFELESSFGVVDEMRVVLTDDTTNVLWPLPGGRFRWSFQLPAPESEAPDRRKSRLSVEIGERSFRGLTTQQLEGLIRERAPWFDADIREVKWALVVPFAPGMASRFGGGRAWLAGDSAHFLSPVGVQSMNVGLREAHELARRIAEIVKRDASLDLLEEYGREQVAEWRGLLMLEGGFEPGPDADPWVASHAERILPCIPASGPELKHLAEQIGLKST
ncbi:MAG: FAD-dependent oxidoreductase [Planctomycetota bacterium]|jgi:2-polyprenyl-6-methoxyphenol hydroxylase-like FAD-dependent oxidoreductase